MSNIFVNSYKNATGFIQKYPSNKRLAIISDFLSLHRRRGLTTDEYYEFEFENRDKAFKDSFLGIREQRYYLELLNPFKYYIVARNKYLTHKVLENTGITTSEMYCYYQPEGYYNNSDECARSLNDVLRILKNKKVSNCVIKTTESSHGESVLVINSIEYFDNDALLSSFDNHKIKLSSILQKDALIFEELMKQTKQFSCFNESSVNTVRFMTTLWPDGSARIVATFIKIGRAGNCVDNAGGGGNVDVCVDVMSGEIKYAIQFDGWRKIKDIEKHPDNGSQLNGIVIDNWQSIKSEVLQFQQSFPFCKAAGWDIAITDKGPVVIEVNDMWDRTGQYFIRRGWRDEIRDCYMAWKKEGYIVSRGRGENDYSVSKCQKLFEFK